MHRPLCPTHHAKHNTHHASLSTQHTARTTHHAPHTTHHAASTTHHSPCITHHAAHAVRSTRDASYTHDASRTTMREQTNILSEMLVRSLSCRISKKRLLQQQQEGGCCSNGTARGVSAMCFKCLACCESARAGFNRHSPMQRGPQTITLMFTMNKTLQVGASNLC